MALEAVSLVSGGDEVRRMREPFGDDDADETETVTTPLLLFELWEAELMLSVERLVVWSRLLLL